MRFLFLIPALFVVQIKAAPAPYIITSYVEVSVYTYEPAETLRSTTYSADIETYTEAVVPKITPVTNAISTSTDTTAYAHVTLIDIVLPPGSGAQSTVSDDYYTTNTGLETNYVVPITYTPYATCTGSAQNWTYVTNVPVDLPSIIATLITPATVTTSASSYTDYNDRITAETTVEAILNPTDVASDTLASASSLNEPYQLSYCYTPTTSCTTVVSSASCTPTWVYPSYSYSDPSLDDDGYCDDYWCGDRALLLIAICVPVGWVVLWLLLGLLESWLSFKGIMLGKNRKRGVPYAWCCIIFLFLCCTGPTYKAKSPEEQVRLAEQWKEMKFGKKLGLWFKWGFRWKYPDMLGDAPEMNKRAFREGCL